jgi:hypothetical protein
MKSPLLLACVLAFAGAASAQTATSNMAGNMSQSGAANVGAGAPAPFPQGGQIGGTDMRIQNRLPPDAVMPPQPAQKPKPQTETKPEPVKPEPKPGSGS